MISVASIPGVDPRAIMTAFAQYGFRKTSMEDIARAAGFSRQSIYTKFGSKDGCYDWALRAYMSTMYESVFAILDAEDEAPMQVLLETFDAINDAAFEFARTPHGTELLDEALRAAESWPENWPGVYRDKLSAFVQRHDLAPGTARSDDIAHLLITASRGALLHADTRAEFHTDMRRILCTVIPSFA